MALPISTCCENAARFASYGSRPRNHSRQACSSALAHSWKLRCEDVMTVMLKPLVDQVMVITGASSGIGLVTAKAAARAGARVVLVARNEADLRKAVTDIRHEGGRAIYVVADVAVADQVEAAG